MPKLTKNVIDKVVPPEKGDAFHWDSELKGFGLRANAAGKSFIVQGRIGSGRAAPAARLTIGRYGVFTVDQARDVARERLRDMRMGIDPRTANQRVGALRKTVREVVADYKRDRSLKPRSALALDQLLAGPITKFGWADKPLASITRADVLGKFLEMKDRAPIHANRTFSMVRAMFNYAAHEYVEKDGTPIFKDNPVNALYRKWSPPRASTTRIPDDKLGAVWSHLQSARAVAQQRDTLAAIDLVTFLLLTGARISEAAELTWDRVNLDAGWWHIPDPKNRNPVWLPLCTQAVELLRKRPTREGWVFPTARGHIKDPRKTMRNISEVAGCELSPHDLRRTWTNTAFRQCRIELWKVEALTNHVSKGVTLQNYGDTQDLKFLKPEVQQVADRMVG
ncbi:MAG: integrase family protein [Reyranella sp.]|nr:integrase family protein [Reyranella sp.]